MNNHYICCTRGCFNSTGELGDKEAKSLTGSNKLDTVNWLDDLPTTGRETDIVEIRFKNTRKGFYKNVNNLNLVKGDIVAVEASPGHDIGVVSLVGDLVRMQMKKMGITFATDEEIKKVYRKAKAVDVEKWYQAIDEEMPTMYRAREHAMRLNMNMKIGDVEFQGDKTKAIFYYIADERVDFRELIKLYAEEFKVRVEMKQIGARQEAGRIGAISSCGRELCCSTWLTNFVSVTTNSARYQEVSLNPQKLAGQCGKLKCCLNYELKGYVDAQKGFPNREIVLELFDGTAHFQKVDIYRRLMWYSFSKDEAVNLVAIPVERVIEIQELNKKGIKPKNINEAIEGKQPEKPLDFHSSVGNESLTRFEDPRKKQQKNNQNQNQNQNPNKNNSSRGFNQGYKSKQNQNQTQTPRPNPTANPNQRQAGNNNPPQNAANKPNRPINKPNNNAPKNDEKKD